MNNLSIGPFNKGINNQVQDYMMPKPAPNSPGWALFDAYNVDITTEGVIKRRAGRQLVAAVENGHSLAYVEGKAFLGIGDSLTRVKALDPLTVDVLRTGLTGSRVAFAGLAGDVWWSDGVVSGRCAADGTDHPWALPTPAVPVVSLGSGALNPGLYRVSITYSSDACGESAGTVPQAIAVGTEGGISVALPASPAGVEKVNVYCTDADGGELQIFTSVAASTLLVAINAVPQGRALGKRAYLSPLPPGDVLAMHNGRLLSASGDTLYYSDAYNFGLYFPAKGSIRFPAEISIVAPCVAGVFVVADKTYWLQGDDISVAQLEEKLPYGAVKGTAFEQTAKKSVGWFGARGAVIAVASGEVSVPQEPVFVTPVAQRGCSLVREVDGMSTLICSLDDTAAYTDRASSAFRDRLQETDEDPSTVAMNLDTGATTRHTGFYMTSMAMIDGKYYGVDTDGVHLLEGDTDNAKPIVWEIALGRFGLHSDRLKHIASIYLSGIFEGAPEAVVRTPSDSYAYPVRYAGGTLATSRADPGRGLRATWYDISVRDANGSYAELNAMSTNIAETQRRI